MIPRGSSLSVHLGMYELASDFFIETFNKENSFFIETFPWSYWKSHCRTENPANYFLQNDSVRKDTYVWRHFNRLLNPANLPPFVMKMTAVKIHLYPNSPGWCFWRSISELRDHSHAAAHITVLNRLFRPLKIHPLISQLDNMTSYTTSAIEVSRLIYFTC